MKCSQEAVVPGRFLLITVSAVVGFSPPFFFSFFLFPFFCCFALSLQVLF